ncbi:MAG: multidrug effflux MFS transporter [Acidobacteria bacterium]|nr:multidrug effflux MFS transporter [Acidobacteriota bacterium]
MQNRLMGFMEFVAFVAACMALNALSIDIMLPALPALGQSYGLDDPNRAQSVIAIYLYGFGMAQILYGPFSDRFGRKPVLLAGLVLFVVASGLTTLAPDFHWMLIGRFLQGLGAGAPRVIALSLTRDRYAGAQMGRVMSLVLMVFMAIPVLAPSLGQVMLWFLPWRWIFGVLTLGGLALASWAIWRLEETLNPDNRRSIAPLAILAGYWETLRNPVCLSYMIAMGVIFGALVGFLTSAQQIFSEVFGVGDRFTLLFACIALMMSLASFFNSRWVMRFGLKRLSNLALAGFLAVGLVHLAVAGLGGESVVVFVLLLGLTMFCFGFLGANFNSLAMEPMGHIAGTASSMIGFASSMISTSCGYFIGQHYNGTVYPILIGNVCLGVLALLVVGIAHFLEKRRGKRRIRKDQEPFMQSGLGRLR